ncbi:hypothetical protein OTU49_017233 [Cherax quadricarinatus]|uniref:Uncharacterized protein n=1 Tax=Cherax quadricarinatus TaxID=27406 RepID=A0AAW0XN70_CHEQU
MGNGLYNLLGMISHHSSWPIQVIFICDVYFKKPSIGCNLQIKDFSALVFFSPTIFCISLVIVLLLCLNSLRQLCTVMCIWNVLSGSRLFILCYDYNTDTPSTPPPPFPCTHTHTHCCIKKLACHANI